MASTGSEYGGGSMFPQHSNGQVPDQRDVGTDGEVTRVPTPRCCCCCRGASSSSSSSSPGEGLRKCGAFTVAVLLFAAIINRPEIREIGFCKVCCVASLTWALFL